MPVEAAASNPQNFDAELSGAQGWALLAAGLFVFAAQNKRLNIQFASGEEPQDMELAMRSIDDGSIDVAPWLGGRIGLAQVAETIAGMSSPAAPIRTVVDPRRM